MGVCVNVNIIQWAERVEHTIHSNFVTLMHTHTHKRKSNIHTYCIVKLERGLSAPTAHFKSDFPLKCIYHFVHVIYTFSNVPSRRSNTLTLIYWKYHKIQLLMYNETVNSCLLAFLYVYLNIDTLNTPMTLWLNRSSCCCCWWWLILLLFCLQLLWAVYTRHGRRCA